MHTYGTSNKKSREFVTGHNAQVNRQSLPLSALGCTMTGDLTETLFGVWIML